jgi:hypothetical protein
MKINYTILALAALTLPASAAIQFTITGTAQVSKYGYVAGQSYNFSLTLAEPLVTSRWRGSDGDEFWGEEYAWQPQLWSSVTGTGITGTFTRPLGDYFSPYSELELWGDSDQSAIYCWAGNDYAENLGLIAPDGQTMISDVGFQTVMTARDFPVSDWPAEYVDPNSYFSSFTGTYANGQASNNWMTMHTEGWSDRVDFTPTSLTISNTDASPVPEPANGLALAGLLSGGLLVRLRKGGRRA